MQTAWFKWFPTVAAGLCVAGFFGIGPAAAQNPSAPDRRPTPPAVDKTQVDQHLNDFLRDAINQGADLYNGGDANGCYNLFRSALVAAWYMLDNHPELRRDINAALGRADGQFAVSDRAQTLRIALDTVRKGLATPATKPTEARSPVRPTGPTEPARTTLWERLGGEAKVRKVIDDFVTRAGSDTKVDFTRGGRYTLNAEQMANFKKQMVDLISQETGGPYKYDGRPLRKSHQGMAITDGEFDASVADLRKALADNNVQAADIDALVRIVEGTRNQIVSAVRGNTKPAENTKPADTKPAATSPTTGQSPDNKKPLGNPSTPPKVPDNKSPKEDNTRPTQGKSTTGQKTGDQKTGDKTANKENDKQPGTAIDVKGKVTFQGKPLSEATIVFVPKEENAVQRPRRALTTTKGAYLIKDIQPGEYTVLVIMGAVPEKYKDAQTSGLKAKVSRDATTFNLDLK